jgi:hypothetical protein
MQAKWAKWMSEAGITVPANLPLEIDPVYTLDAADLKSIGINLSMD